MALSSTQVGAIGENLLSNAVLTASDSRLSPFQPVADDDGIAALFFDKSTAAVAIQLKCRTVALFKPKTQVRGNGSSSTTQSASSRTSCPPGNRVQATWCSRCLGPVIPGSTFKKTKAAKQSRTRSVRS